MAERRRGHRKLFDEPRDGIVPGYLFERAQEVMSGERQAKLGELASALRALEAARADEEDTSTNWRDVQHELQAQVETPETFDSATWYAALTRYMTEESARPFGSYCHGGEDLMADFLQSYGLVVADEQRQVDIWRIVERVVAENETQHCDDCRGVIREIAHAKEMEVKE